MTYNYEEIKDIKLGAIYTKNIQNLEFLLQIGKK